MRVGNRVQCIFFEETGYPVIAPDVRGRIGKILKIKAKRSGNIEKWCHLIEWEDGSTDTQCETYLRLLTPLEELL